MTKTHYTAFEAANLIFPKASVNTCSMYINQLFLAGELKTTTKVNGRWLVTHEDVERIRPKIWSGELKIVLPRYIKEEKK